MCIGQPDQRGISEINILVSVLLKIGSDFSKSTDWNPNNLYATPFHPLKQFHLCAYIEKETSLHDHGGDCEQGSTVTAQILKGLSMQRIAPNIESNKKAGINEQPGHGISPAAIAY